MKVLLLLLVIAVSAQAQLYGRRGVDDAYGQDAPDDDVIDKGYGHRPPGWEMDRGFGRPINKNRPVDPGYGIDRPAVDPPSYPQPPGRKDPPGRSYPPGHYPPGYRYPIPIGRPGIYQGGNIQIDPPGPLPPGYRPLPPGRIAVDPVNPRPPGTRPGGPRVDPGYEVEPPVDPDFGQDAPVDPGYGHNPPAVDQGYGIPPPGRRSYRHSRGYPGGPVVDPGMPQRPGARP